jgi:hypothetical protein
MVITPRGRTVYTKVSELTNPITRSWDMQLLNENFFSIVMGRILQIPINDQGFDDSISWSFTKHGRYIVVQAIIYSGDTFFSLRAN